MAVTLQTDEGLIRPLDGSTIRRYTAGAPLTAGQQVEKPPAGPLGVANGKTSDTIADLSFINIPEPPRRDSLSIAAFCFKKKKTMILQHLSTCILYTKPCTQ